MRNYFIFDDVASTTFNTYIATSNMFDSPQEDVDTITIAGNNNIIYINNGRFYAFTIDLECYVTKDMQTQVDLLRNFLQSRGKACKYIEALKPDEYRIARYISAFSLGSSDRNGAALKIKFNARPERFLISGDTSITFTSDDTVENPTNFDSKPLIRAYSKGRMTINGYEITINSIDEYVDIDCESMQCYKGSVNCNNNVVIDSFPVLSSGENEIELGTVSKIDITPKWWTI